jgi:glycosyltransferase involved in cell wall biosynthesis
MVPEDYLSVAGRQVGCSTAPGRSGKSAFSVRVSILTPSYNQARFLAENLASVRAQGEVEHIVADGGSSDGSRELLEKSGVRFFSERDRGQADALNKALKLAGGEIIGWLNSDDLYCDGAVARALQAFDADPTLDVVYGHSDKIDGDGRGFGRVDAYQTDLEGLLTHATIPQPSAFLRRAVLERAGGVDVSYRYAMDYDLWLRLALGGARWRAVDETWAKFRIHGDSKSGSQAALFLPEVERAMESALASPRLPPSLAAKKSALRRRYHANVGQAALAALDLPLARRFLWRAARLDPAGVDFALLSSLGKSLLPRPALLAARALKSLARRPT